jgi:hypothetical protein
MSDDENGINPTPCSRRQFLELSAYAGAGLVLGRQSKKAETGRPPRLPAISHRRIRTNGIGMHIAEAGTGVPVVFLHGFPETWYSWRHQLPAFAAAGDFTPWPPICAVTVRRTPREHRRLLHEAADGRYCRVTRRARS